MVLKNFTNMPLIGSGISGIRGYLSMATECVSSKHSAALVEDAKYWTGFYRQVTVEQFGIKYGGYRSWWGRGSFAPMWWGGGLSADSAHEMLSGRINRFLSTVTFAAVLGLTGCTPHAETQRTSVPAAVQVALPGPRFPRYVMKNASEAERFLRENKFKKFKDTRFKELVDSSEKLKELKKLFSHVPGARKLFTPPPIVATLSGGWCLRNDAALALYQSGTNFIGICRLEDRDDTVLHEMAHYIHWRASGFEMLYSKGGNVVRITMPFWMIEGFAHTLKPLSARPCPTRIYVFKLFIMLEKIVGDQRIARQAVLFGDLRRVQRIVDSKLGRGTFQGIVESKSIEDTFNSLYFEQVYRKLRPAYDEFRRDERLEAIGW